MVTKTVSVLTSRVSSPVEGTAGDNPEDRAGTGEPKGLQELWPRLRGSERAA